MNNRFKIDVRRKSGDRNEAYMRVREKIERKLGRGETSTQEYAGALRRGRNVILFRTDHAKHRRLITHALGGGRRAMKVRKRQQTTEVGEGRLAIKEIGKQQVIKLRGFTMEQEARVIKTAVRTPFSRNKQDRKRKTAGGRDAKLS